MGGTLTQPCRVREVGPTGREPLLCGDNGGVVNVACGYHMNKHRLTPCQQPR